jgi:ligand-binding sensor domain-containing protein/signal transduction histidine kinase
MFIRDNGMKNWLKINSKQICFIFVLLAICMISPSSHADIRGQVEIETLLDNTMLSKCSVRSIVQDNNGFMWFGTTLGMYRYDGHNLEQYLNEPDNVESLNHSHVQSILQDKYGALWVGTFGGGLNRYLPGENRFEKYQHDPDNDQSISSDYVTALLKDSNGNIWVGTIDGVTVVDDHGKLFRRLRSTNINGAPQKNIRVLSLFQDTAGVVWIGSETGLYRYAPGEGTMVPFPNSRDHFYQKLSHSPIRSVSEDKAGYLWIGTINQGLYRFDPNRTHAVEVLFGEGEPNEFRVVEKVLEDRYGLVWIATSNGLYTWNRGAEGLSGPSIELSRRNPVRLGSMFMDRFENLWFGYLDGGVGKVDLLQRHGFSFYQISKRFRQAASLSARGLCEDRYGHIWAVPALNQSGGLLKIDIKSHDISFTTLPVEPLADILDMQHFYIRAIIDDSQGEEIKISLRNGQVLNYNLSENSVSALVDPRAGFLSDPETRVSGIILDAHGDIWLKDRYQVIRVSPRSGHTKTYGDDGDGTGDFGGSITALSYGARTGIWVATADGHLFRFDTSLDRFKPTCGGKYLPHFGNQVIYTIFEDSQGDIWLGTDSGLMHVDPQKSICVRRYKQKDGLQGNLVKGIAEDSSGNLWLGTLEGIVKLDRKKNRFLNFGAIDVQIEYPFSRAATGNAIQTRQGSIYFIGLEKIVGFNPQAIVSNPHPPEVAILQVETHIGETKGLSLKNDGVVTYRISGEKERLVFPSHENTLRFSYTALHYSDPEKNSIAIKLVGKDQDWQFVGNQREKIYADLKPGNYAFRVKAANSHGVWNETGAAAKFKVLKPYWMRAWFIVLCIAVTICIIIGVVVLQARYTRQKTRRLESLVEKRTRELARSRKDLHKQEQLQVLERVRRLQADIVNISEHERQRVGQLFHEDLSPHLMGTETLMHVLVSRLKTDLPHEVVYAEKIENLIHSGIEKARNLAHGLAPRLVVEENLSKTLQDLADVTAQTFGVVCELVIEGDEVFKDPETKIHIFFIVQEAVYNAIKHASARRIDINLILADGHVKMLSIKDNGSGFSKNTETKGMGLQLMKIRAEAMGVAMDIQTSLGDGTNLRFQPQEGMSTVA